MPFYKTPNNSVHFIESEKFAGLLPFDAVEITEEEAHALIANAAAKSSFVPEVVTMRQARLALLQAGLLAQVNTAVANMPGAAGDTARIEWEFSSTVERNRPLVQSLIGALGLTESQLDDLFRLAAAL